MRKRDIRIQVRLSDIQYKKLLDDIARSKETISSYIRKLIIGTQLKEKPDYEFYNVMKELTKIGVNLNQIAHVANSTNIIDKDFYNQEAKKWNEISRQIKNMIKDELTGIIYYEKDDPVNFRKAKKRIQNRESAYRMKRMRKYNMDKLDEE